jgi:hypothetical protein
LRIQNAVSYDSDLAGSFRDEHAAVGKKCEAPRMRQPSCNGHNAKLALHCVDNRWSIRQSQARQTPHLLGETDRQKNEKKQDSEPWSQHGNLRGNLTRIIRQEAVAVCIRKMMTFGEALAPGSAEPLPNPDAVIHVASEF